MHFQGGCCPREGCGLHAEQGFVAGQLGYNVAVPVRGAGCMSKSAQPGVGVFMRFIQPALLYYHKENAKARFLYRVHNMDTFSLICDCANPLFSENFLAVF